MRSPNEVCALGTQASEGRTPSGCIRAAGPNCVSRLHQEGHGFLKKKKKKTVRVHPPQPLLPWALGTCTGRWEFERRVGAA